MFLPWLPLIGGAISGIGSIAGGAIGASGAAAAQDSANAANAAEAQKNRDWQESMSSSAHFREVHDLRRAGLNPVLSANSGASSPSGAMATAQPVNHSAGLAAGLGAMGNAVSTALDVNNKVKEGKQRDAQTLQTVADTVKSEAQSKIFGEDLKVAKSRAESAPAEAALKKRKAEIDTKMAPIDAAVNRILDGLGGVSDVVNIRRLLEGTRGARQRRQQSEERHLGNQGIRGSAILD